MILLLDNYDSFVHNLARYVEELGLEPLVRRNDALTLDEIAALAPSHIIISPGPCSPTEAGISTDVVRRFGPTIPILGVCLGHQCIGEAYGGQIVRARRPMHGKTSRVTHDHSGVFAGLPSPLVAT
ncbi:MAG TPA: aminodeoxychorismate/anthranilate synthase component II, partial [Gemmatimonadales bacterium]|nr:aminodeoxychorismate/anthranilate synthase component II [Gemmatimonadales bacterium]